jgi:threonine/homoserine/homoserine lactone efflux protein
VTTTTWVEFGCLLMVVLCVPGPDFALIVARTVQGRRAATIAALGVVCGLMVHTLAAAIGLTAVVAAHPAALTSIRWLSASYLMVLGVLLVRRQLSGGAGAEDVELAVRLSIEHPIRLWWTGFGTNVLNPKALLFFVAVLPRFIEPGAQAAVRTVQLAAATVVAAVVWWALVIVMVSGHGVFIRSRRGIEIGCGVVLVVFGIGFAVVG